MLSLWCVHWFAAPGHCDESRESHRRLTRLASTQRDAQPEALVAPEPSSGLTLVDLEGIALANNRAIQEAFARVEATRGRWVQAGLPPNPIIGYSGQQLGSSGQAEQNGVLIGQEIVRGGKLRLSREVAAQEISLAEQEAEVIRRRVLTDTRIGYFDVLFAEHRRILNQQLVTIGEKALQTANSLFEAQTGSRIDILQATIEIEQARILLSNSQNQQQSAWRSLSAVVGQPLSVQAVEGTYDAPAPNLSWEESLSHLVSQSPEVAAAAVKIDRAQWALQRACVEPKPNITVEGIIQHDAAIDSSDGNLQVTFPVPILNRNQGAIREARAQITEAQQGLARVEASLANRLAPVFERYANAKSQVDRYSAEILPAAESALELTTEGYRSGEISFLTLLTAQRTFFQTSLAYLEAQRELWLAVTEIDGMLLTNSLESP
jgi:cobalt-zinc-cadmium efflux system outer membrane protein